MGRVHLSDAMPLMIVANSQHCRDFGGEDLFDRSDMAQKE